MLTVELRDTQAEMRLVTLTKRMSRPMTMPTTPLGLGSSSPRPTVIPTPPNSTSSPTAVSTMPRGSALAALR